MADDYQIEEIYVNSTSENAIKNVDWGEISESDILVFACDSNGDVVLYENWELSKRESDGTWDIKIYPSQNSFTAYIVRNELASMQWSETANANLSVDAIKKQIENIVRVIKQLELINKTVVRTVDDISVPLPCKEHRKGKFISFDDNGNPVANVAVQTFEDNRKKAETAESNAKDYAEIASNSASASSEYADLSLDYKTGAELAKAEARAWAVGSGDYEDTIDNNAKYYAKSAREIVEAFDDKVDEATSDFNSNATSKTTTFDNNASSKLTNFNDNAISKTGIFNQNYASKTNAINQIASDVNSKVDGFDDKVEEATSDFNSNATSKLIQFNNNVSGVLSQAKSYATEAKNARDEAVLISDPEEWRTDTRANISSLAVAKANRGEFWFNGGFLTCANKRTTGVFSFAITFSMTEEEYTLNSSPSTSDYQWLGTCVYSNTADTNAGFFIVIAGNKMQFFVNGQAHQYVQISNAKTKYADGKSHVLFAICDGTSLRFQIDDEVNTIAFSGFRNVPDRTPFKIFKNNSKVSRIKYFNFDMSADDAPYTIADYIAGKDESPLLYGSQPVFNWANSTGATLESIGVLVEDNRVVLTNTDEVHIYPFAVGAFKKGYTYRIKTSGSIVSSQSMRLICPMSKFKLIRKNIITGEITDASASGSITAYLFLANGNDLETELEFTATEDSTKQNTYLRISAVDTSATNSFTMSAENIGALLSLEDVKSGVQILDKSGNANNANISGTVYASKENNPARCVDSASFSWAGTATTQKFANSDVAIPANSKVVAYAKASVGMSASFTCGGNSAVSKELSANTLTEIGSFLNASQGAFKVAPSSAITGKMEVYLTIEKF